jgi:phosphopantetheine--protein transferase-like protein
MLARIGMTDYKPIIATFLKIDPSELRAETPIDRSALQGSILLHRMHAKLAQAGCHIDHWSEIRTFGDLERAMSGQTLPGAQTAQASAHALVESGTTPLIEPNRLAVGIDIEEIANLPLADDYREHPFYKSAFTPSEISYCIMQVNPASSFAGLFSVKEAIVKAGGSKKINTLIEIGILHDDEGRPCHTGYELSLSHSGHYAVAVALRLPQQSNSKICLQSSEKTGPIRQTQEQSSDNPMARRMAPLQYVALLASLIALVLSLAHILK